MRRTLIAALCAVLVSAPVLAEDGPICLFSDAVGSSCNFTDSGGLMEFYVVHQPDAGVTAAQFAAPVPGCMTGAVWVGDTNPYLAIGNTQTGLSVAYGGCVTGPILVSTIQVLTVGLTSPDCPYPVVPDPAATTGFIEVVDCAGIRHLGTGGTAYVNSTLACKCGPGPGDPVLDASPLVVSFAETDNSMPLSLTNIGAGTLSWQVLESLTWLTAAPLSGSGDQTVTLNVDRFGLQVGHYTETLWVASNGGNATVTIELDVGTNPILGVNPSSLHFGESDGTRVLTVFNAGTGPMNWSIDPPAVAWLSVDPPSGVGTTRVDVTADRSGLAPGVYNTSLHVTSDGGDADVPVQVVVGFPPILGYSPTSIDFGTSATFRFLNIANNGEGVLSWDITPMAPWVTLSTYSGSQDATILVYANRSGLLPGTHTTFLDISSNGGNAQIPVSLIVPAPVPALGVTPGSLSFSAAQTQRFLTIFNAGTGTLTWNVASSDPWMSVAPNSGEDGGAVAVTVDRTGLADGTYSGFVYVSSNGGDTSVPVSMLVDNTPHLVVNPTLLLYDNFTTVRTFSITNTGGGTLEWQLSADQTWIEVDPPLVGTGNAGVVVRVDLAQIPGTQIETGFVTVASNGGVQTVEVRYIPPSTGGPAGAVSLYGDPAFTQCAIQDTDGLVSVYVVHEFHAGASALQFAAPVPGCWSGAVWVADQNRFPLVIGTSQAGMAVSYGGCYTGQIHVTTMLIIAQGQAGPCCDYYVQPDPAAPSGLIEAVDCAFSKTFPNSARGVVNENPGCPCGYLVSVETKTWGGVKALYAPDAGENK